MIQHSSLGNQEPLYHLEHRMFAGSEHQQGNTIMSNSEDSTVTYTAVFSPYGGLSDIGSPGVIGPEHEGLPWMQDDPYVQVALQAPPSPDYIPGPEGPRGATVTTSTKLCSRACLSGVYATEGRNTPS
ncbi:hypothetical protein Tco_0484167 [Tanacetum coccineum]